MAGAFLGDAHGGTEAFGERGQAEPGLRRGLGAGGEPSDRLLVACEFGVGVVQLRSDVVESFAQDAFLLVLIGEFGAPGDEVVGGEPQAGVAQVGLDGLGAARHLGLTAERFELAAQLGGEVGQARQVGLHRVELADRLLLALAVFEDTGSLLDEGTAVLRPGLEDGGEAALTDDDVHLPADAGVGQQFLHVHQPARGPVDLVFPRAVAEHPPGDGHLGVLDGQRAVGVVDGEGDLGPAQGLPAGGAGEDDVLHLAAAQRLGALLAHHPGEGVDDVGLAGTVRPHDTRDARFEPQSRRGRERLEALERQTLQIHVREPYRRTVTARRSRSGRRAPAPSSPPPAAPCLGSRPSAARRAGVRGRRGGPRR